MSKAPAKKKTTAKKTVKKTVKKAPLDLYKDDTVKEQPQIKQETVKPSAQEQVPSQAVVVAPPVEKKNLSFLLVGIRKYRLTRSINKRVITIEGDNSVIKLRASDPDYAIKLKILNESRDNKANGGRYFRLLDDDEDTPMDKCMLDSIIDLRIESLRGLVNEKVPEINKMSRGRIIMQIMKEKGLISS